MRKVSPWERSGVVHPIEKERRSDDVESRWWNRRSGYTEIRNQSYCQWNTQRLDLGHEKVRISIMTLLRTLFSSQSTGTDSITILPVQEYRSAISKDEVQLVDVRTEREYRSGHIPKALNIDFFQRSAFKDAFAKLDKNKPVYLYCRSGNRSLKAAKRIVKMGFKEVYDLKGGILSWS